MCLTKKFPCLGLLGKDVDVRARETVIMATPKSPPLLKVRGGGFLETFIALTVYT
jgi:hypothetical protein